MTAGQVPALGPLTEREWQAQVTDLAEVYGWQWLHLRAAMTAHGWRTPISGPLGSGWPDLVLVHPRRHLFLLVELKSNVGRLTGEQRAVHEVVRQSGLEVEVWAPRDFSLVERSLR
jgi:hypothetical protein